jgi:hypothetical protein
MAKLKMEIDPMHYSVDFMHYHSAMKYGSGKGLLMLG